MIGNKNWLVLAPIPMEKDQEGPDALGKQQVKDEASLKPKADDKIEVDGKELTWKAAEAKEGVLNFNDISGGVTPNSVAYAVSTETPPNAVAPISSSFLRPMRSPRLPIETRRPAMTNE